MEMNFEKIIGYNPFIAKNKNNARLGKTFIESYIFYFEMLSLLAQSRIKWNGIPEEIPQYQIEKCLFYTGMAGITYDDVADEYVILPVAYTNRGLNMYGEPNKFKLFSYTNAVTYNNLSNGKNGLICYNNSIKSGNLFLCYRYATRLQAIDTIIDMNIDKQKCPYIIIVKDRKEYLALKSLINQLNLNKDAIYETKNSFDDNIKTLDLRVELKSEDLMKAKREIYNEACLYLGITSSLSSKKERLINSEIENETMRYEIYRQTAMQPREYFCKRVKKLYGLDISVEFSTLKDFDKTIENTIIDTNIKDRKKKVKTIKEKLDEE